MCTNLLRSWNALRINISRVTRSYIFLFFFIVFNIFILGKTKFLSINHMRKDFVYYIFFILLILLIDLFKGNMHQLLGSVRICPTLVHCSKRHNLQEICINLPRLWNILKINISRLTRSYVFVFFVIVFNIFILSKTKILSISYMAKDFVHESFFILWILLISLFK